MASQAKTAKKKRNDAAGNEVDVLIIGAGISGIGVACRLTREHPELSFQIVERRARLGGTWDLFRYPGIRSDSDMYTFGYDFRPWTESKVLADGDTIRRYLADTVEEFGIDERIAYGVRVLSASWSSAAQRWTVTAVTDDGEEIVYVARFYVGATGYYDYDAGYRPSFPNESAFAGPIIHPQHWPEDFDYAGKRIAVIGSGATAVTLIPNMADTAKHITMIQRSPTYIVPMPAENALMAGLQDRLPPMMVYRLVRGLTLTFGKVSFGVMRTFPAAVKKMLVSVVAKQLDPGIDIKHFTPNYAPWDQRVCVVPDGDLFTSLNSGKASIVTDTIEEFTETGIRLSSGEHVDADVIITATGLNVAFNGGVEVTVDGAPIVAADHMTYKAVLLTEVPNAAFIFGYTNASWTLKADLAAEYLCRLLTYMTEHNYGSVVATGDPTQVVDATIFGNLTSGYVQRAAHLLPKQGRAGVWKVKHDYLADYLVLRHGAIEDSALKFTRTRVTQPVSVPTTR